MLGIWTETSMVCRLLSSFSKYSQALEDRKLAEEKCPGSCCPKTFWLPTSISHTCIHVLQFCLFICLRCIYCIYIYIHSIYIYIHSIYIYTYFFLYPYANRSITLHSCDLEVFLCQLCPWIYGYPRFNASWRWWLTMGHHLKKHNCDRVVSTPLTNRHIIKTSHIIHHNICFLSLSYFYMRFSHQYYIIYLWPLWPRNFRRDLSCPGEALKPEILMLRRSINEIRRRMPAKPGIKKLNVGLWCCHFFTNMYWSYMIAIDCIYIYIYIFTIYVWFKSIIINHRIIKRITSEISWTLCQLSSKAQEGDRASWKPGVQGQWNLWTMLAKRQRQANLLVHCPSMICLGGTTSQAMGNSVVAMSMVQDRGLEA